VSNQLAWLYLPGRDEQIPQVSVIMRPIVRNVHGGGLKPSELI